MSTGRVDGARQSGPRERIAVGAVALMACLGMTSRALSADLSAHPVLRAPPEAVPYAYPPPLPDPGPTSTNGYYGYYGSDIQGVPYYGLYSEDVTCLRSALTPRGYRVVDVCRTDR